MIRTTQLAGILLFFNSGVLTLAAPISVLNPSFESPAQADGGFSLNVVDDWVLSNTDMGVQNPIAGTIYSGPGTTDGEQTAYINRQLGNISQVLSDTLLANTTYTLKVDIGDRNDFVFPGYLVQLIAGSNVLAEDDNTLTPDDGFLTSTVTYEALPGDPNLGMPLRILLSSNGPQVNFDNVRLDAVTVPEPTAGVLILCGVGIIAIRRYRSA